MTLELYVWGPAFGLPSIDARCLAAIAYLRACLPQSEWSLFATSELSRNPLGELPALKDGTTWIAGFDDIVDYLRTRNSAWNLDAGLSPAESANCTAYTSFLHSRGRPLLDLSLYVSSENYAACTSPALGTLLSWPNSWVIPHQLREKAKKCSEHLGLSGLDVDSAQEEKEEGLKAQIPKSLKKPRQTVSALLGHDARRSKFRLDAVTTDFLEPLEELLGESPWLISDHATSADCLAVGYLALMQFSGDVPQPWLRSALRTRFAGLGEWSQIRQHEWFGKTISTVDVLSGNTASSDLPWQNPSPTTPLETINSVILSIASAIPVVRTHLSPFEANTSLEVTSNDRHEQKQQAITRVRATHLQHCQTLISSFSAIILTGVLAYNGLLRFPFLRRSAAGNPRTFGEAGALLGLG